MGLGDLLFGRKRLKQAKAERLFALATAQVTLEAELGLRPAGAAGVCYKPLSAGEFARAEGDVRELVAKVARESGSTLERRSDRFGFEWIVFRDPDFEDLVASVHLVGSELEAQGFGDRLLAALFRFEGAGRSVYFVYGYKRGAFWPFVPSGAGKKRDNALELELKAKLEPELPIEPDLSSWLGLFDAPL